MSTRSKIGNDETPKALGPLGRVKLDHVVRLTDDVGILQHARYLVPDRSCGYCTDDNARALITVLMTRGTSADNGMSDALSFRYLSFLQHAFNDETGRFRNFMGYDRRWLEQAGSEDSQGRAIWALGETVARAASDDLRSVAGYLFEMALPALKAFGYPRAWAFALTGLHAFLSRFAEAADVRCVLQSLAERLYRHYQRNATDDWPWIEDTVTYANGKIPQALLLAGGTLNRPEMVQAGLRSLEWLAALQTDAKGDFAPVGNKGWYPRHGKRARFDQQSIEALSMVEACRQAYEVTNDVQWMTHAEVCVEWLLGRNDARAPLYDPETGGCCDGLGAGGPNRNRGAESTLVCLLSLLHYHQMRDRGKPPE